MPRIGHIVTRHQGSSFEVRRRDCILLLTPQDQEAAESIVGIPGSGLEYYSLKKDEFLFGIPRIPGKRDRRTILGIIVSEEDIDDPGKYLRLAIADINSLANRFGNDHGTSSAVS